MCTMAKEVEVLILDHHAEVRMSTSISLTDAQKRLAAAVRAHKAYPHVWDNGPGRHRYGA